MQAGNTVLPARKDRIDNLPLSDLLSVIKEFLGLLVELQYSPSVHHLSVVDSLLHVLTELETQLAFLRTSLERERLIHNDLRHQIRGTTP
jgi:hypothetical protein